MNKIASTTDLQKPFPVIKGHWLLGNLPEVGKNPMLFAYNKSKEVGDTFDVPLLTGRWIMTSNADFIKYALQTNHRNYTKGWAYDQIAMILGNGLVTSKGAFWQKQRRLAQPAFYKKNLEELFKSMSLVAENYIQELAQKKGKEIDLEKEMMEVTAKIAMKALFSSENAQDLRKVYDTSTTTQRYVNNRIRNPFFIPWSHINGAYSDFKKDMKILDEVVERLIRERRNSSEKQADLMQLLMDAVDEESGEAMTEKQLRDEVLTLFSAGHETSANAMVWTLYELSKHPEIVAKLRAESAEILGDRSSGFEDLRQLTYHRKVLEESMRLYPPAWVVSRVAKEEDEWQGNKIKKGDIVYCAIYSLHRSENYYKNPEKFDPERFAPEKVKERHKMCYLPFGAGPRLCIGNHFAMMEMQLLLSSLVRNFDFKLVENQQIELEPLVTLRPKYGMKMKLE